MAPGYLGLVCGALGLVPGALDLVPGYLGLVPGYQCLIPGYLGLVPGSLGLFGPKVWYQVSQVVWVVGGQDGFQGKANCPPLDLNLTHYLTLPHTAGKKLKHFKFLRVKV